MTRCVPLLLLAGCANLYGPGEVAWLPGQDIANIVVWRDGLGRTDSAPAVKWVRGDELNCTFPGGARGFRLFGIPHCLRGYTPDAGDGWEVSVAIGDDEVVADTQVAHEFMHASLLRDGRDQDKGHRGLVWQPGELVEQMEERLMEASQ